MDNKYFKYYKLIGDINNVINNSKTIDEVLKKSLGLIMTALDIKHAVIWYKDDKEILHPYYSICSIDLTLKTHKPGEGIVGKVYQDQTNFTLLDFKKNHIQEISEQFKNIDITSYVCSPIANNSGKVGAIEFVKEKGLFNDDEANVLEMISMLASIQINDLDKFVDKWENGKVLLTLKDVKKDFKNGEFLTKVLKGVNLDIYQGEFVVILGESGCGKSTLLNIIGGMDKVSSGQIFFKDKELSNATEKELTLYRRYNIGFIFQSYNLMPNLNVKENLDLIGELVDTPLDSLETLKLVGLEDKAFNYPSQLSGGQQQRVSIARALVKHPTIIMADEPTAALDYETSIEVLTALESVYKNGTTLLMVTHNEQIAKMANRVIKLRNGEVYEITVNRHPSKATDLIW